MPQTFGAITKSTDIANNIILPDLNSVIGTAISLIEASGCEKECNTFCDFWINRNPIQQAIDKLDPNNLCNSKLITELNNLKNFLDPKARAVKASTDLDNFNDVINATSVLTETLSNQASAQEDKLNAVVNFETTLKNSPLFKTEVDANSSRKLIAGLVIGGVCAALGLVLGAVAFGAVYAAVTAPAGGIGAIPGIIHGALHGSMTGWALGTMIVSANFGADITGFLGGYAGVRFFDKGLVSNLGKAARANARASKTFVGDAIFEKPNRPKP